MDPRPTASGACEECCPLPVCRPWWTRVGGATCTFHNPRRPLTIPRCKFKSCLRYSFYWLMILQGSCKLPSRPRPDEVAWWFGHGRRRLRSPCDLPPIKSIEDFKEKWIRWWSAIQPTWRNTSSWPFVQEDPTEDQDWGSLPNGGKDGLFLIVVSLGWWIYARPQDDDDIEDAVRDVTWVFKRLISVACAEATNPNSTSGHNLSSAADPPESRSTRSSTSQAKRSSTLKIGPPRTRSKRARI